MLLLRPSTAFALCLPLFAASALLIPAASASLLINEVMFNYENPDSATGPIEFGTGHQWVELFNAGPDTVNANSWTLADSSGTAWPGLPSLELLPGEYMTVHCALGVSDTIVVGNAANVYLNTGPLMGISNGECALFEGTPSGQSIRDFVAWHDSSTTYLSGVSHGWAVSAGQWISGDAVITERSSAPQRLVAVLMQGSSIGRDAMSSDSDSSDDFAISGGSDAFFSTMNSANEEFDLGIQPKLKEEALRIPPRDWLIMIAIDTRDRGTFKRNGKSNEDGVIDHANTLIKSLERVVRSRATRNYDIIVFVSHSDADETQGALYRIEPHRKKGIASQIAVVNGAARLMHDPASLGAFVQSSMASYPATRNVLELWGHGLGWLATMVMSDDAEYLDMVGLRSALKGQFAQTKLDVLSFNSCYMGMLEVANQVSDYAHVLIAPESIRGAYAGYPKLLPLLDGNWSPQEYAKVWVRYDKQSKDRVSAAINLDTIESINVPMDAMARELRRTVDDTATLNKSSDNYQVVIQAVRKKAKNRAYSQKAFLDLWGLAKQIDGNKKLRAKVPSAKAVMDSLSPTGLRRLVIHRRSKNGMKDKGLSIYFPDRMSQVGLSHPMDAPVPDGWTPGLYRYGPNLNCTPTPSPMLHPMKGLGGAAIDSFIMHDKTAWHAFLERYYEPAPEAVIIYEATIDSVVRVAGCSELPIKFKLSALGSSDIDQEDGNRTPESFHWDVDPGTDSDDGDWDHDCVDEASDDNDVAGIQVNREVPGNVAATYTYIVSVMDDHDLQVGHTGHYQALQDTCRIVVVACDTPEVQIDPNGEDSHNCAPSSFPQSVARVTCPAGDLSSLHLRFSDTLTGEPLSNIAPSQYGVRYGQSRFYGAVVTDANGIGYIAHAGPDWLMGESCDQAIPFFGTQDLASPLKIMSLDMNLDGVVGSADLDLVQSISPPCYDLNCDLLGNILDRVLFAQMYSDHMGHTAKTATGGPSIPPDRPASLTLRAIPNPFNPRTTIAYSAPESGGVWLGIYDTRGRLVRSLVRREVKYGEHEVLWNGRGDDGIEVSSGVYFVVIRMEHSQTATKIALLR